MGKTVLLVSGKPQQGKTTLCKRLRDDYGYYFQSIDEEYVGFIRLNYPDLYFNKLGSYIGVHYNYIYNTNYFYPGTASKLTDHIFEQDVLGAWQDHLLQRIRNTLTTNERIVVDGYLLKDCLRRLSHELQMDDVNVIHVLVKKYKYYRIIARFLSKKETIGELAAHLEAKNNPRMEWFNKSVILGKLLFVGKFVLNSFSKVLRK